MAVSRPAKPQLESASPTAQILAWLDSFIACIRGNDTELGRTLFAADVVGYGARTDRMLGLDDLVERQWAPTWPLAAAWTVTNCDVAVVSEDLGVLCFTWNRTHTDDSSVGGRATIILRCSQDTGWLAIHSHFSLSPSGRV